MSDTVQGRLDLALARVVEEFCTRAKAATGIDFWNGLPGYGQSGLKQITEDVIDRAGIPRIPIDLPRTLASNLVEFVVGGDAPVKSGEPTRSKKRGRRRGPGTVERARRAHV